MDWDNVDIDPGFDASLPDESNDWGFDGPTSPENIDPGFDAGPPRQGILDGLPSPYPGSSLNLLLDPQDIATIPGLPAHVYENAGVKNLADYADQRIQQDSGGPSDLSEWATTPTLPSADTPPRAQAMQPSGYVSSPNQVSLTPLDWQKPALNISTTSGAAQPRPGDKYAQGAKAADYTGNVVDAWNLQNHILGLHFGMEGPRLLEKYGAGPLGNALVPVQSGLEAAGEIANGAPVAPTLAGAGIKTISTLGGMEVGASAGAGAGAFFGVPEIGGVIGGIVGGLAPGWTYRNMSNRQIGDAAGRITTNMGHSYSDYVINNPYYDPRLAAIP